jgi:ABC-type transport system involved in cytochrome c biogenesis permease component
MMTYLTLAAMLALVLFPLLIPTTITAVHAVRRWQPTSAPARMAGYPRRMAPRRLAAA